MKILTMITALFLAMPVLANNSENKTDFYFNVRVTDAKGLQKIDEQRIAKQEFVTRIGIRHHHTLYENLLFDVDARVVYEYSDFMNTKEKNLYFELKRLSLEIPTFIVPKLSAKFGRISYRDKRTWWYDNTLDMVKLFHNETLFSWDLSVGGRLSDEKASAGDQRVGLKGSKYIIAHLDYHYYYKHHFEAFGLYEDNGQDKNPIGQINDQTNNIKANNQLSWLGFRAYGEYDNINYWGDIAYLDGNIQNLNYTNATVVGADDISVNGFAIDIGGVYKTDDFGFGLGLAHGSGDNDDKSSQNLFLQPSISNNKDYMIGTSRYRYYGEMLDPQLSNINIISLYGGLKLYENMWIESNYHKYIQQVATTQLRSSNLFISTNGLDRDIGQEVDIVVGGRFNNRNEIQLIMSGFFGGDAFSNTTQKKDGYRGVVDFKIYW